MTNDSKTSGGSQLSNTPVRAAEILFVAAAAVLVICCAAAWVYSQGYILYYGDAQAHLSISRGIVDARVPGYGRIGNVWLPVLHVICIPFVMNDWMWRTGFAGTIPVAACFVAAVVFFYAAVRETFGLVLPAVVAAACFALNPNILYLSSIPMTELVFFAGAAAQLFALMRFARTGSMGCVLLAALASIWSSLTRYDGWVLIPFVAVAFLALGRANRWKAAIVFSVIAALAPFYWFAHNWWQAGDALSFYRGPFSAKAIYERGLRSGQPHDPGDHNWPVALKYYLAAGGLVLGWPLMLAGGAGAIVALWKRAYAPVAFLLIAPCFYVLSMHSSGNPIHIPTLWPFSYYNSRYATALMPLLAFGVGALATFLPARAKWSALILPLIAMLPWLIHPSRDNWVCWKESQRNSESRRFWVNEVAGYLRTNYRKGQSILFSEGDVPAVFAKANIPLSESLSPGDGVAWLVNNYHPGLLRTCEWAIVVEAAERDMLALPMDRANWKRTAYEPVLEVYTKYDPVVRLYRRSQ